MRMAWAESVRKLMNGTEGVMASRSIVGSIMFRDYCVDEAISARFCNIRGFEPHVDVDVVQQ